MEKLNQEIASYYHRLKPSAWTYFITLVQSETEYSLEALASLAAYETDTLLLSKI